MKYNPLFLFVLLALWWGCNENTTQHTAKEVSGDYVGAVLPFPAVPSASVTGETLGESKHVRRAQPDHLPKNAPNILIVLMDDVGGAGLSWRRFAGSAGAAIDVAMSQTRQAPGPVHGRGIRRLALARQLRHAD